MSILTEAELDQQISAGKKVLLNLAKFKDATAPDGRRLTFEDSPEAGRNLAYFEIQKKKIAGTSGPSINSGRPAR